ncbi:MAG: beta-lactamase family protein [Acidobacteriota bacterium]|nr:beta-lactamase family protein [Acidobacteriota bacterium]
MDLEAEDADEAVDAAWAAYKELAWPLKVTTESPDKDGWSRRRRYEYQTSPNERRTVLAGTLYAKDAWTVWIYDMAHDVGEKRGGQVSMVFDRLLPKGYSRESFAGKTANELDEARLAEIARFVRDGMEATGVPGVSYGIVQDGEVVFSGGFGVRKLGDPTPPDGDTLYMIASNTKGLSTLMLAKLVDEGKLTWKTPAIDVMPSFAVADPETTSRVLVEHLVCACTGMPRQDMEWLLEYGGVTPEGAMELLATMEPTSDFGALFQYSNMLAGAAGFVGGYLMFPDMELGAAYDKAMQSQVFDPLGMTETTFDYERALAGNVAMAHAPDIDGNPAHAIFEINRSVIPLRPAGAGWSNVNDMLKYVAMELAEGALPDGGRYISKEALFERREPKVAVGNDASYGMGLMVDTTYGTAVVHHGGDMIGYHSDMMWLPEHDVGAVVLTNGDPGWYIRSRFQRKLLEVLFDGEPLADKDLASDAERYFENMAADRELLDRPADPAAVDGLAAKYANDALGEVTVVRDGETTYFDFGEWQSEVATRVNPDETISFITITPGFIGAELVIGTGDERTLTLRDSQHEYVFEEM